MNAGVISQHKRRGEASRSLVLRYITKPYKQTRFQISFLICNYSHKAPKYGEQNELKVIFNFILS